MIVNKSAYFVVKDNSKGSLLKELIDNDFIVSMDKNLEVIVQLKDEPDEELEYLNSGGWITDKDIEELGGNVGILIFN